MTAARRVPSALLVALQLALIAALVVTTQWDAPVRAWPLVALLIVAAAALGVWTLRHNRLGNFSVRPEVRAGARLVTGGPYRWIRHPMYASLLLGLGGLVVAAPRPWRVALLAALVVVLLVKAAREEEFLRAAFAGYADYAARTWRLVPFVY